MTNLNKNEAKKNFFFLKKKTQNGRLKKTEFFKTVHTNLSPKMFENNHSHVGMLCSLSFIGNTSGWK